MQQQAVAGRLTPADAAAQLVQLGEAEALGVVDDHDGGFGHVDADFDHGGGDEELGLAAGEGGDRALANGGVLPAMGQADAGAEMAAQRVRSDPRRRPGPAPRSR